MGEHQNNKLVGQSEARLILGETWILCVLCVHQMSNELINQMMLL